LSRRLGLAVERGENTLDTRNVGGLEVRLAALLAHLRGQRVPVHMVAVAVDAERGMGALHLAFTMHALHDHGAFDGSKPHRRRHVIASQGCWWRGRPGGR
jgi:hypothetical protein